MTQLPPYKDPRLIKKMADLLRSGAAMLAERCPQCGLPLFRLKSGEVICPLHGRVYIVRTEEEAAKATLQGVLEQLERVLIEKIGASLREIKETEFTDEEKPRALIVWLEALERVERLLRGVRTELQELQKIGRELEERKRESKSESRE